MIWPDFRARIAGSETQESFVGSDFTYEDIGGREFDDYTYALELLKIGETVKVAYVRGGKRIETNLTPAARR